MKSSGSLSHLATILQPLMAFDPLEPASHYAIGQLSAHLKVSLRTLRFYEQTGLLLPSREGIRRLYSPEDLERLQVIVALRELEVSLMGIKALIATADAGGPGVEEKLTQQLDRLLSELRNANDERIGQLTSINARIAQARQSIGEG